MRALAVAVCLAVSVALLCSCGARPGGTSAQPSGSGMLIPSTYNISVSVGGATVPHLLRLLPPSETADHLPEIQIVAAGEGNVAGAVSVDTRQSPQAQVTYSQGTISVTYDGPRDQSAMSWFYLPQGVGAAAEARASSAEIVINLTNEAKNVSGTIRLTTDDETVQATRTYEATFTGTRA